jgi:CheY-like chemotaxis protein
MIADDLTDRGYEVAQVENGTQALARLDRSRPDAIVLDLMMPDGDGWSFLERYRNDTAGNPIPIVAVSAARALPRSYERLGVRKFLCKPFRLDELARWLDRLTRPQSAAGSAP